MLRVYSGRDLSDWSRPPLFGKDFVCEFSRYDLNIRSRHGFVIFSVSLGRDLSDWSRPPLGSLKIMWLQLRFP